MSQSMRKLLASGLAIYIPYTLEPEFYCTQYLILVCKSMSHYGEILGMCLFSMNFVRIGRLN